MFTVPTALMKGILRMYIKYAIRTNVVIIFVAMGFIVENVQSHLGVMFYWTLSGESYV